MFFLAGTGSVKWLFKLIYGISAVQPRMGFAVRQFGMLVINRLDNEKVFSIL